MATDIVSRAEKVVKSLKKDIKGGKEHPIITTSQLRKFLAAVNSIKNKVLVQRARSIMDNSTENGLLREDVVNEIKYLKVMLVYQIGRQTKKREIQDFVEKSNILNEIDNIGNSESKFIDFTKYVEAIVAYHKYYGGRD